MLHALGAEDRPPAGQHARIDARPSQARRRVAHIRSSDSGSSPPCRPASSASRAASSLRTPSCIHTTLAPMRIASRVTPSAASDERKMSTMSTGSLDVGKRSVDPLAEDLLAGLPRIDGDHGEALLLEILHGEIARPRGVGARPHHGDGAVRSENVPDIGVAIGVVIHRHEMGAGRRLRKALSAANWAGACR